MPSEREHYTATLTALSTQAADSQSSAAEWLVSALTVQFALNNGVPVASSVPATEHSVMTAWATEKEAIDNMLDHFGSGLFSCVMDSYDYAQVWDLHRTISHDFSHK